MVKSTENTLFCHLFEGKICVFQYNLVGGTLGKLLENHENTMLFHALFVGGYPSKTMEKSTENTLFRHLFFLENLRFLSTIW